MIKLVILGKLNKCKQVAQPQMNSQSSEVLDHLVLKDFHHFKRLIPRSVRTKFDVQTHRIQGLQLKVIVIQLLVK